MVCWSVFSLLFAFAFHLRGNHKKQIKEIMKWQGRHRRLQKRFKDKRKQRSLSRTVTAILSYHPPTLTFLSCFSAVQNFCIISPNLSEIAIGFYRNLCEGSWEIGGREEGERGWYGWYFCQEEMLLTDWVYLYASHFSWLNQSTVK